MNCHVAGEMMNGWIDGQVPAQEAVELEAHLSECAECRGMADALRVQDAELRRAFQPQRRAAMQVASRVLAVLDRESQPAAPTTPEIRFGWGAMTLAAAAGFLLAVMVFQPWKQQPIAFDLRAGIQPAQTKPPIAHLVVATGDVEMRATAATAWQAYPDVKAFQCPSGGEVRTGTDVRCELQTSNGCVIRLNHDTEITLASPTDVAIRRGQIWCSSPENVSLKIVAPEADGLEKVVACPSWSAGCASSSSLLTAVQHDGNVQVMTATGETELQTPSDSQRLKPGEQASIVDGQIVMSRQEIDPIGEASWIHSLLVRKDSDGGELERRIGAMLSQVGRDKTAWRYEQEIRGLGEHAVLPLLRYVRSPQSEKERECRLMAMRLLSDLSPSWTVPDLIDFLSHEDADIRVLAATALQRLTGLNQGRSPQQWRENLEVCGATIKTWQRWWANNRHLYSSPPVTGSSVNSATNI